MRRLVACLVSLVTLLLAAPSFPAVEIYQVRVTDQAPAWVYYTLNCAADVTIGIYPAEAGSQPVRTVNLPGQPRGKRQFLWNGLRDDGAPAPEGAYRAVITAVSSQAQWDPIVGLYKNDDWVTEYSPRPLPSCPNSEGFYGIAINRNPNSPYYGRIYVSHKVQKHVLMYDPDGEFIGQMDDSSVSWGSSAPWDVSIAEDDYVYIDDRTNKVIHCFTPEGAHISVSPPINYSKAIYAHRDAAGVTHVFQTGGPTVRKITLSADHLTWGAACNAYTPGADNLSTLGLWVSPDLQTIYNCYSGSGANAGLTRWHPSGGCAYARDSWASSIANPVVDAEMSPDGSFLWVTRMTDVGGGPAINKVRVSNGAPYYPPDADYDVVTWALMCATDAVGNVAVTFGKNTSSWAQYYWGLFAEPGVSQAQKTTGLFTVGSNGSPVIEPESVSWTFENPDYPGRLPADGASEAVLEFAAYDCNGWIDIAGCQIDLSGLGQGIVAADSISRDMSDPNGRRAIVRKQGIHAARGSRCGSHELGITLTDFRGGTGSGSAELQVAGSRVSGYVGHTRFPGGVQGAAVLLENGPIAYNLGPTDASGFFEGEVSEGAFTASARKTGFGTADSIQVSVPMPSSPPAAPIPVGELHLRPCTVAEAAALSNGVEVNVEGVCFAWPAGHAPTAAGGMAARTDTMLSRNQWYVCDPGDPARGMLCLITSPTATFLPQWDDPAATSTYIGKRPAPGETIMLTGLLDLPGGHERRVLADDSRIQGALSNGTIGRYYQNRGDLGGLPADPAPVTCADVARNDSSVWGRFARTTAWVTGPKPGADDIWIIADSTGTSEMLLQTPASLGFTEMPSPGCLYTITGASGQSARYGSGVIRVRRPEDLLRAPDSCGADDLASIRQLPSGSEVIVSGALTGRWADFFYIEDTDRRVGVRVQAATDALPGSVIKIVGTLGLQGGERIIVPTAPPMVVSAGTGPPEAYDLRSRDIGGAAYDAENPGVAGGRGALNVGLRVHLQGMVTARDPGGEWFYLWDGANSSDVPVGDGTGNIGVRVKSALACAPWADWVSVTGVVSADSSTVPGRVVPVLLATSASVVTAFDTISAEPGEAAAAGWSLIGLPAAPAGSGDSMEFSPKPWDAFQVLSPGKDPFDIDGRLYRWEDCVGGLFVWDVWMDLETHGPFGGLLLGDGYWLQLDAGLPVSYSARPSSLDQWTGICAPGWMIIGLPKDHPVAMADVRVHDGGAVCGMYDAVFTNGWIDCTGYWWDGPTQGLMDIGIPECWASASDLLPWHGYWLQAYRGGLALVFPD